MNIENLSPRQKEMMKEIAEHLYHKYANSTAQSFVDTARAVEGVLTIMQEDLAEAEAEAYKE